MRIDLTVPLQKELLENILSAENFLSKFGHFGTHFDVMNKTFPLEYGELNGRIFDVSGVAGRDIETSDIDLGKVQAGDFVILRTGVMEREAYGSPQYFSEGPQLSRNLLEQLAQKKIALVGIDMAGVRKGREHRAADQFFADQDIFVVENLYNLEMLMEYCGREFIVHTYPLAMNGVTGLTSRVVAEIV